LAGKVGTFKVFQYAGRFEASPSNIRLGFKHLSLFCQVSRL
jgi:hypothetical protein